MSSQDYMFLDPDRTRPLTYRVLTGQFKAALVAVGYEGPPVGLHGIRVEGFNNNKAANGEDVSPRCKGFGWGRRPVGTGGTTASVWCGLGVPVDTGYLGVGGTRVGGVVKGRAQG